MESSAREETRLGGGQDFNWLMLNTSGQLAAASLALMASQSICFQSVNCTPSDRLSIDPNTGDYTLRPVDTRYFISWRTFLLAVSYYHGPPTLV